MSSAKKIAAHGTWTSPISSEEVSGSSINFKELHVNASLSRALPTVNILTSVAPKW
jgi:hypothetical protein